MRNNKCLKLFIKLWNCHLNDLSKTFICKNHIFEKIIWNIYNEAGTNCLNKTPKKQRNIIGNEINSKPNLIVFLMAEVNTFMKNEQILFFKFCFF